MLDRFGRVAWLEMLKHSGVIKDYSVTDFQPLPEGGGLLDFQVEFLPPTDVEIVLNEQPLEEAERNFRERVVPRWAEPRWRP